MGFIKKYPFIPAKAGNQYPKSIQMIARGLWVPAFAGMNGLLLLACGQASTETSVLPEAPKAISEAIPTPSKSLTLEDIDFNAYSKTLAKFTGLKEGQSRGEAVDNVRLYFAPEQGSKIISTSQSTFEREDGSVLLFSASGLADDAVKADKWDNRRPLKVQVALPNPTSMRHFPFLCSDKMLHSFGRNIICF